MRKLFLGCVAACLLIPPLYGLVARAPQQTDNRVLAAAPAFPSSLNDLVVWPRAVDSFLNDHFGLRSHFIEGDTLLHWRLFGNSSNKQVVVGNSDRLFFWDGDVPFRTLLGNCGAWWSGQMRDMFARDDEQALTRFDELIPNLTILVIPTSSALYQSEFPEWIKSACRGHSLLVDDLLAHLPRLHSTRVIYPTDIAGSLPAPLIPKHNFHWAGRGIEFLFDRLVAILTLTRQASPTWVTITQPSDLARYAPGVGLSNQLEAPQWNAQFCTAQDCMGPIRDLKVPFETFTVVRPGDGGKLLLLSDSFGSGAASSLIGFFSQIIDINLNNFGTMSPGERRQLWIRLMYEWKPDRVYLVLNDGNFPGMLRFANLIPDAQ